MMKVYALLLAMLAMVAIHPAQAAFSCFSYFTRGEAGKAGSQTFKGITTSGSNELYDNPMFYTKAAADAGFSSASGVKGRFSGTLPLSTGIGGPMTFTFFSGGSKMYIKPFDKNTGKGTITGGTGCFTGIKGSAVRTTYATAPVKRFSWKFCPTNAAYTCRPK
jgi:hypothetical protein